MMGNWKEWLEEIDDDYLIGIANKGLVKRAYKDKEAGDYEVMSMEEEAQVRVGEETVQVRYPLGESGCSCPSRTICRHVILGILAVKEKALAGGTEAARGANAAGGTEAARGANAAGGTEAARETNAAEETDAVRGTNAAGAGGTEADRGANAAKETDAVGETAEETAAPLKASPESKEKGKPFTGVEAEIAAYPFASLQKILGVRQIQAIVSDVRRELRPAITKTSIITVQLPRQEQTVKLLSPLEYSTCTCHKKEFCVHKAAAVLWYRLENGMTKLEELEKETGDRPEYEIASIKEAAGQMKTFLEELLDTGLARVSPDVLEYLERLAIISHNAKLARFEGYWRALYDSYGNYLKRKASFRIGDLMQQTARLYRRVELLLAAGNSEQVFRLAGEFKSEYIPIGNLDLIGIAMEHFESQTGYAGETIYFLEEHTKEWYTYTSARPMFYDKSGRAGWQGKAPSPWGLPVSLVDLTEARIRLQGARSDGHGRLSSSQETKGELAGDRRYENRLHTSDLGGWYYTDFGKLFREQIGEKKPNWLREQSGAAEGTEETEGAGETGTEAGNERDGADKLRFVFLRPDSCAKAVFSETEQRLYMSLYDAAGREVVIEVGYSKREAWGIRYLERLREKRRPCFFGKIYLRDGRIRMYPIAVLEKGDLEEDGESE